MKEIKGYEIVDGGCHKCDLNTNCMCGEICVFCDTNKVYKKIEPDYLKKIVIVLVEDKSDDGCEECCYYDERLSDTCGCGTPRFEWAIKCDSKNHFEILEVDDKTKERDENN
jgi:hypothetical protein